MSMSRREILGLLASSVAGTVVTGYTHPLSVRAEVATARTNATTYQGQNLTEWNVDLGDALDACRSVEPTAADAEPTIECISETSGTAQWPGEPWPDLDDIQTIHEAEYSELRANVHRRLIMAHNITHKRIVDDEAFTYIHTAGYRFRIPYELNQDPQATECGETIEGGLFVWDGKGIRSSNNKLDYGIGFQINVNPWQPNDFGKVYTWGGDSKGWLYTGQRLTIDTEWHGIKLIVDFQHETTSLVIDSLHYPVQFTHTSKKGWGEETAARLQVELVSKHPKPEGVQAMHRLQVKDWFWTQEYTTYGVYLPYIVNSSTTSACPSVYLTAPVSDTKVPNPVTVSWYPDPSPMTIQYYQNQTLIGETENALSGTAVEIPPGWTQIKIWEGGQVLDTVWFEVI